MWWMRTGVRTVRRCWPTPWSARLAGTYLNWTLAQVEAQARADVHEVFPAVSVLLDHRLPVELVHYVRARVVGRLLARDTEGVTEEIWDRTKQVVAAIVAKY